MRVALAGGGTGGHVYPALSVAEALRRAQPAAELLYLGTAHGAERDLAAGAGLPFRAVHAGQVRGMSPRRLAGSALRLSQGVADAQQALAAFRPDAVFATGGYASVPVVVAARLQRLPLLVFLPDVYPGWAVRLSVRLAGRVATTATGALAHLPRRKTVVTGYPVRPDFWRADRCGGRRRLGLGEGPVLLVSGGSQGALAINEAVIASLTGLLEACQVVHVTGPRHEQRALAAAETLPAALGMRYHVYGYLADMPWAMAAADLALLRSGASSLAEPPAAGLPAILVPGSYSDQHRNAAFMQRQGAAVLLEERRLPALLPLARDLFASPSRLASMAAAARRLARPDAAERLAALLLELMGAPCVPASVTR